MFDVKKGKGRNIMVLSNKDILKRCKSQKLIEDYCDDNIQTCSYDLRMGNQYYYDMNDGNQAVNIGLLKEGEFLRIPPDAICYVITKERVNMPEDLTASISLSLGLIKCGVMLAAQPPYDPGYQGKTVALLHNLSNETVKIRYGQHILNIVFSELSTSIDINSGNGYKGVYQGLNDLGSFCQEVRVGAVFELKQELMCRKERFNDFMPNILTAITVAITALTILFSILVGRSGLGLWEEKASDAEENVEFRFNRERNTLNVYVDDQLYEIELTE